MKKIPLTKGKFALVDDEDYDRLVAMGKWYYNGHYAARTTNPQLNFNGKLVKSSIYMHRVVTNAPKGMDTDHKDGDKLNNQRSNLRVCSRSQNKRNVGGKSTNISGYKGVSWSKKRSKWQVRLKGDGKQMWLGYFENKIEAAKVYNEAALKYHGEFAQLNEI